MLSTIVFLTVMHWVNPISIPFNIEGKQYLMNFDISVFNVTLHNGTVSAEKLKVVEKVRSTSDNLQQLVLEPTPFQNDQSYQLPRKISNEERQQKIADALAQKLQTHEMAIEGELILDGEMKRVFEIDDETYTCDYEKDQDNSFGINCHLTSGKISYLIGTKGGSPPLVDDTIPILRSKKVSKFYIVNT